MNDLRLSRRSLVGFAAAGATGLFLRDGSAAPQRSDSLQVPPPAKWTRFEVGKGEGFVLSDGRTTLNAVQPTFASEATAEELNAALDRAFHPRNRVVVDYNVLLLRFDDAVILVDTGSAPAPSRGPVGKLRERLAAAGIAPESIDLVFITHCHGDHIGGLLDADRKPVYPNARIAVSRVEHDFWTSPSPDLSRSRLPADRKERSAAETRRTLEELKDRIDLVDVSARIHPRLELLDTRGHTPGHCSLIVRGEEGGADLLVLADVAHNHVAMFADPDWTAIFDVDPLEAARSRRALFDRLVAEPMRVLAYHLPWPGFGWVRAHGRGYEWVVDATFV